MPPQQVPVNSGLVVRATGGMRQTTTNPPLPPVRSSLHQSGASYTPRSLLEHHSLPVAAYLHTQGPPPSGLDPKRPLLLYKTSQSAKIRAVSLKPNSSGGISTIGPTLVIPDNYTGWFSVVSGRCKGASCLTTIEEVADGNISFFLTRHEIPSYVRIKDSSGSGHSRYRKSVVAAGNVLKLLGLFEDTKRGTSSSKTLITKGERFAQCLDHKGDVVFIPLSAKGKFYATADKDPSKRSLEQVYLMSQLVEGFDLPLTVRLVCGFMAKVPQSFTGLLKLESSREEKVMLACTMTTEADATFLEMDLDSNFLLTPLTDPVFTRTPIYLKTKSYCQDQADSWQRQIKVTHHVTERRTQTTPMRTHNSCSSTISDSSAGLLSSESKWRVTRALRIRDKSRDKSRDRKLRVRDKSKDRSSFDILRAKTESEKLAGKDNRKLSKQNTYIFQNNNKVNRNEETPPPVPQHSLNYKLRQNLDSQDYSMVLDDIRQGAVIREEEEYAEICDRFPSSTLLCDSRSASFNSNNPVERDSRRDKFLSSNWSFGSSGFGGSSEDNMNSFTLLQKDVSAHSSFLRNGFSVGHITPLRQFLTPFKHAYRPRSPVSSEC